MAVEFPAMSLLDKFEIDLAIRQERYYRDTALWEALRSMWHPDNSKTLVDISWYANKPFTSTHHLNLNTSRIKGPVEKWIHASRAMHKTGIGPLHTMQPAEILIKNNRATAISTISIRARMAFKGSELDLESWAHQHQRFEKVDGMWKIVRFEAVYVRDSVTSPFIGQDVPKVDEEGMKVIERARPSFKYLAWQMSLIGETVRGDIPGYDDERTWKALVERHRVWLETGSD